MTYHKGEVVSVRVVSIHSFGVFAQLPDGTPAYIRRRELSLEGDIDPEQVVREGDELQVVVSGLADAKRVLEVSLRQALKDPWPDFIRSHKPRDQVIASVKHFSAQVVYVQIQAGINGYILVEDLTPQLIKHPGEILWVNDRVEGEILQIETAHRRVRLGVRQHIENITKAQAFLAEMRGRKAEADQTVDLIGTQVNDHQDIEALLTIQFFGSILAVEDDESLRNELVYWLQQQHITADGQSSGVEALALLKKETFHLVIVDLDMPEMDGITLIEHIRAGWPELPVAVMSDIEWIKKNIKVLHALNVQAIFPKPLDRVEFKRFLEDLQSGVQTERYPVAQPENTLQEFESYKKMAHRMRVSQPLIERFQSGVDLLVRETQAEEGILFRIDPGSGTASIVVASGNLSIHEEAVFALVDSPVKDVIVNGETIWENHVTQEHPEKFRKLIELLSFESCVGQVVMWGEPNEYGLFIFHSRPEAFARYRIRDVQATAALFSIALESHTFDEHIQALGGILLSGQLAAGFAHEINNKIQTVDFKFSNLYYGFTKLEKSHPSLSRSPEFRQLSSALEKAVLTAQDLKESVENYRRLIEARKTSRSDVNHLIRQCEAQVNVLARRANVKILLDLAENLPETAVSPVTLQQIFLNLIYNAIQQMEIKNYSARYLEISSCFNESNPGRIEVRFKDNGPGIHYRLWEKIFEAGITTREGGSGLGLFIARSLLETAGGRVTVEESLIPMGAAFLVEIPVG